MALHRKGFRPLKVGERTVYWCARKAKLATENEELAEHESKAVICVTVVGSQAFKSGKSGQRLEFAVPRGSSVGSVAVRYVVEQTPEFTGAADGARVAPQAATLAQALAMCAPRRP
jgi:hypothetical protein